MASIISYTKYTNVFSCPDDIKNLKIQIRIRKKGIEKELLEDGSDNVFDCKVFRWQEKVFNNFEKVFYKNINNCLTDIEKNYNKIINDTENMEDKSILSSYVDEEDCPFKNQNNPENDSDIPGVENGPDEDMSLQEGEDEFPYQESITESVFLSSKTHNSESRNGNDEKDEVSTLLKDYPNRLDYTDENLTFALYVSSKLRKYDVRTKSFVQHAINNILFNADLGKYDSGYIDESSSILFKDNEDVKPSFNSDPISIDCSENEGKESYNYLRKLVEEVESYDAEEEVVNELFDYKDSVIHCIQNPVLNRKFEFMWIVADFGYYIDETWIKYEKLLCTIKYNKTSNSLSIFPDFTKSQPYSIEIEGETNTTYLYFIENVSSKIPETISLNEKELIRKITNQKTALKSNLTDITFLLPPKNKLHVVLFLEILSANHFEYNDIFVQYFIDLPKFWTCHNEDTLSGLTQICCGKGDDGLVHFSYCCDVLLEYNIQQLEGKNDIPKMPYIYFEVISKDSWKRYRTEGLTYKTLPVHSPGSYFYNLCCFRLSPQSFSGNLRRFFIGDCSNYNDITWIGIPKDHQGNTVNKFGVNTIGTGQLNIRINVIHQSQAFMKEYNDEDVVKNREKFIFEKLNSSSLIKSVEQVLQAFRKARKNMIAARKNI